MRRCDCVATCNNISMIRFNRANKPEELALTITTQTFIRILVLILGTVAILAAFHRAAHALVLVFVAFFLALALNAPVHWIGRHIPGKNRNSRALATTLSFLLVILLLGAFLYSLVPPLVRQTQSFINAAPSLVHDLRSQDSSTGKLIRRYHLQNNVDSFSKQLSDRLQHVSGSALSTVSVVGSSVFATLTVLVLTFMMLVEGPRWVEFARRLIPKRKQAEASTIAHDMYRVVKGYVNGQVTLAAIAAVFIVPALFILHISYPVALMVVVFVCGLIPMVGHTIGAVIVTAVALFHSIPTALIILAYYILYQQIENYLIQPRIQANSTNLSPLMVFLSVVIGVSFNGLLGGLVAIPIAGCLRVLILFYLESENKLSPAQVTEDLSPRPSK